MFTGTDISDSSCPKSCVLNNPTELVEEFILIQYDE